MKIRSKYLRPVIALIILLAIAATATANQPVPFSKYYMESGNEYRIANLADTTPVQKAAQEKKEAPVNESPTAVTAPVVVEQKVEAVKAQPAVVIKTVPTARRQVKPVPIPKVITPKPVKIVKPKIIVKTGLH